MNERFVFFLTLACYTAGVFTYEWWPGNGDWSRALEISLSVGLGMALFWFGLWVFRPVVRRDEE